MSISADNRRIAKNTLALYARMGVTMLVSLFTSRVVLQTLGVENFGIYNVVGGVVVLFSFLNAAMSSATQRFLNFELGKKDLVQVGRVFSMSMSVHFCIAGAVLILAETVGLWFLNTQLNIPVERMAAANWVYQFSVASTLLGIMLVPYNATIIAYERMTFFAIASVATSVLRLGIVYLLWIGNTDKLVLYAALVFAVGVIMQIVHVTYCQRAFPQTAKYKPFRDKKLFKELISFSGWSLVLGVSNIAASHGLNMVFNIFHGVVLNAAMGIANQVNVAVYQLSSNFQIAYTPQIIKRYATSDYKSFFSLINQASKISFSLLSILVVPVIVNTPLLLKIWLGTIPDFSVSFVRLILIFSTVDVLVIPLAVAVQAIGKIRNYQLLCSLFIITNLPLAILLLKLGTPPEIVLITKIVLNIFSLLWRGFYLKFLIGFPVSLWIREVFCKMLLIFLASLFVAFIPFQFPTNDFFQFFASTLLCWITIFLLMLGFGLSCSERSKFLQLIRSKLKR